MFVVAANTLLRYRRLSLQLKASEQHLRSIFDTALDAIVTVDYEGRVRSANPAVTGLFGWSPQEMVGMHIRSLVPARLVREVEERLASYLRTGNLSLPRGEQDLIGLTRQGKESPYASASASPMSTAGRCSWCSSPTSASGSAWRRRCATASSNTAR